MTWKLGPDSFTKCVVYFADGNTRTFYSLDWCNKYTRNRDRQLGLKRLHNLIGKYGHRAKVAIIYDNATGAEIEKFNEGIKQDL